MTYKTMDTLWVILSPATVENCVITWLVLYIFIMQTAVAICRQASADAKAAAHNLSFGGSCVHCTLGILGSLCDGGHARASGYAAAVDVPAVVLVCSTAVLPAKALCAIGLAVFHGICSIRLCVVPTVLTLDMKPEYATRHPSSNCSGTCAVLALRHIYPLMDTSSVSKINVAPPGMIPLAPRSPACRKLWDLYSLASVQHALRFSSQISRV